MRSGPVAQAFALPNTPACNVLETLPYQRLGIDLHGFHVLQVENPPVLLQIRIDVGLWILQRAGLDRIHRVVAATTAKEPPNAPFDYIRVQKHWFVAGRFGRVRLEHPNSCTCPVEEQCLEFMRDHVIFLSQGPERNQESILVAPSSPSLGDHGIVMLRTVVVVVGS